MKRVTQDSDSAADRGTASILTTVADLRVPGVNVAGKTGTATIFRKDVGKTDIAWFICFAPAENPKIAIAVAIEGEGGSFGGGLNAVPVASAILKRYFDKLAHPNEALLKNFTASLP